MIAINNVRFVSLKKKLTRFCLIVFAVLLSFSVYVYATNRYILTRSQDIILLYKSAANYYMVFDHIDRALYQFAHTPSDDLKKSIETDGELLIDISATLSLRLDDPVARDQPEIARNYVNSIKMFLENDSSISVTEMLREYEELYKMKLLITRLNKTLEVSIEAAGIENKHQVDNLDRWQRGIFLLLLVLLGMLSIIYTRRFSGKLLGPILHLTEITKTAWDTPDYAAPQMSELLLGEGEQDETYILTYNFHHMFERLGKQMAELQEKARLEQQLRIEEAQREDRTSSCIIKGALSYIDQNYQKSITLDSVADHVFLSPTYFSALFKKETGVNYIEYLTGIRMNAAKKLLKELDHSVTQVGESVGYKDPKQFRKQFIKSEGITPSAYRMSNMH